MVSISRYLTAAMLIVCSVITGCVSKQTLFDGHSLDGWWRVGAANWDVVDGNIVGSGDSEGYLSTEASFGDFTLRVEFWVDATTNSGIYIRCKDRQNIHPETCYELNIWDQHPNQNARTGAIVFKVMPPLVQVDTVGHWNVYEVTAVGSKLVVKVNDSVTAVLEDADPAPGFISLQHWESGTVMFRNLEIKSL